MSGSGLLTLDQTAAELNVEAIAVRRLVSRRHLKATRLGDRDDWRITAGDLQAYIRDGAADLHPPAIAEGWFDGRGIDHLQSRFVAELQAAAEAQFVDQATAQRLYDRRDNPTHTTFEVEIELSAEMVAILERPFVVNVATPKRIAEIGLRDLREAVLVSQLRTEAKRAVRAAGVNMVPTIERLFGGPEQYAQFVADAVERTGRRRIVAGRAYPEVTDQGWSVRVDHVLPWRLFATEAEWTGRLLEIAF